MIISDTWQIEDRVSGLKIRVVKGAKLYRLHLEHVNKPMVNNRDFFFASDGEFDGTGSGLC